MIGAKGHLLAILVDEARERRRKRRRAALRAARAGIRDGLGGIAARLSRASALVERSLRDPLPPLVDCSRYLPRVITRQQMASVSVAELKLSVQRVKLDAESARALAAALVEFLNFVEAGVDEDGSMRVYLAVALDEDYFIVGLGVEGDVALLAPEQATASMLCGARIVRALGGEFQRGVDGGRMVFGVTLPTSIVRGT